MQSSISFFDHIHESLIDPLLLAILSALCITFGTWLYRRLKKNKNNYETLKNSIIDILRLNITQIYFVCIHTGSIKMSELDLLEKLFAEYENLGGNGTIKKIVSEMRNLPINVDIGENK